ncbi:CUB and sushi domain-containing protein 3-like isoform X2 [Halichondria panicea]|uniref:CUB and sushi domain-containing protein 3-like isoform X2 n=1 Tax=Halichondria panicea TaxID=6063 RepID=UPI00312B4F69
MDLLRKLVIFAVILLCSQISKSSENLAVVVGVCSRTARRSVSRSESYLIYSRQSYRYYSSCGTWLWPSRCSRTGYRKVGSIAYKTKYSNQYYRDEFCCLGYAGRPPSCQRICPSVRSPNNGVVRVTTYNVNGRATYTCNTGYRLSGLSSRTCSSSGSWSGSNPSCQRSCPILNNPSNGRVSVSSYFGGGRCTYSCNTGYRLSGSSSRTCSSSGSWSGSNPSCRRISCPTLNNPSNGRVSVSSYFFGSRGTYSCNTGYGLSGSSSRTCLSSGSWSGSNPSCQRICPTLNNPSNGRVSVSSYFRRGTGTYSCNTGYGLSGSSYRTCSSSGSWSGSNPSCQRICPTLNHPSNGRVSVSSYFGRGRGTYSCNTGYGLSGSSSRTCSSSGSWSGSNPSCLRICPTLNNPSNGRVSVSSYFIGSRGTYSCNTGYGLSGSSSRTCSSSGSWSGSNPSCQRICPTLNNPSNGRVSVSSYFGRGRGTYSCNTGYRLSGSSSRTCSSSGSWSGSNPSCQRICPTLNNPSNGRVSVSSYFIGSRGTYSCNTGYGLSGSSSRTCSSSGSWSGSNPSCQRICPTLNNPSNGRVSVSSYFGRGRGTYSCNTGYRLSGSSSRTCSSSGSWSGSNPSCQRICPTLNNPSNGRVSVSSYFIGSRGTYSCNTGYGLSGSSSRTCSSSGSWSGSNPSCQRICPTLNNPSNGRVSVSSYFIGSRGTYSCNTGYGLSGSSSRTCSSSGSWSGSNPSCQRICPTLNNPSNGRVSVSSYFGRGRGTYSCNTGYRLSGSSSRTCSSSGSWSGSNPSCRRICPTLNNPSNGRVSVSSYFIGSRGTYSCNTGYGLSGLSSRTCSSSGSWSGSNPSCRRVCPLLNNPSNGRVSVSSCFIEGKATYSCNTGYRLSGSYSRTCSSSGSWSGSNSSCQRENEICDSKLASFAKEQNLKRERVVQSIVTIVGFAPELVTEMFNTSSHNESNSSGLIFKHVYTSLSETFNVAPSEAKFNKFVEAVTEISIAEDEACSGSDSPSAADIPGIVIKFNQLFSAGKSGDITEIRSLYGQILCIKRHEQAPDTNRSKRSTHCPEVSNCGCPEGDLDEPDNIICACHFFGCLDPDQHMKPMLGFDDRIQCLAFVIDTTGSMSSEIAGAKKILTDFIRAEENLNILGCYLLVPFNDVGPDNAHVPDASVGNISVAYTDEVDELLTFYSNLNGLQAKGGGDGPEYSLDAMLKALKLKHYDDSDRLVPWMMDGSQMIVITDAPSKHQEIELNVSRMAYDMGVCIHFFVSDSYGTEDGLYKRVADETNGQLIFPFSNWDIAKFASSYMNSPCAFEVSRRKRAAIASRCQSFHISELSILFRFSGNTDSSVILTRPSGTTIEVLGGAGVAVHSEGHPEAGEWLACLSSGDLEFSVDQDYSLDATLGYLKKTNTGTIVASIVPPTECSTGQVMLSTSKNALIVQSRLSMLGSDQNVIQTAHLAKCSDAFVANMSFPRGEYTFLLEGVDTSGVWISYRVGKKVVFRPGEYELVANGKKTIEIELSDTFGISFSISNLNSYASTFDFSTTSPGFIATLQKKSVSLSPGEIRNVVVVFSVSSSSVRKGSTHTIEFRASNGCVTLSDTKIVMIKAAGTPPPAEVCGCQNGGTCVVQTRRGREFKSCLCPSGYRGRTCET